MMYLITYIVCAFGLVICMYLLYKTAVKIGYTKGVIETMSKTETEQDYKCTDERYIVTVASTYADAFTIPASNAEEAINKIRKEILEGKLTLPESTRISSRIECAGRTILIPDTN